MAEIKELDFQLSDEGWNLSGGKSFNIWGLVDFPKELLKYILDYKKKTFISFDPTTGKRIKTSGKRAPVWTAFDKYLYHDYDVKSGEKLPKISATFKFSFDHKYSAIVENMGMQIALALDMPTAYNYIVAFTPEKHPEIAAHLRTKRDRDNVQPLRDRDNVQPLGIVSVDFLQARQASPKSTGKKIYSHDDVEEEIDSFSHIDGDELIPFEDLLDQYHIAYDKFAGEDHCLDKWIAAIDQIAYMKYSHMPREQLNKTLHDIHSRIARSFLLKDCLLGDCDFTSYNAGIVTNAHKIRYAANHDYGDTCAHLIKQKLIAKPNHGISQEDFDKLLKNVQEYLTSLQASYQQQSVEELASQWASNTSKYNFYYVLKNFPQACSEFFKNLDNLARRNQIAKIVDQYTKMTLNGQPLLTKEEATMFKKYLTARLTHYCDLYVEYLNANHSEVPQEIETDDYSIEI
ncbi:MAG: hypothetical protein IJY90_00380 [Clostridia bacterium]|nr:hypothetical protein [Clostridia bacterium]